MKSMPNSSLYGKMMPTGCILSCSPLISSPSPTTASRHHQAHERVLNVTADTRGRAEGRKGLPTMPPLSPGPTTISKVAIGSHSMGSKCDGASSIASDLQVPEYVSSPKTIGWTVPSTGRWPHIALQSSMPRVVTEVSLPHDNTRSGGNGWTYRRIT
ncbi:hypothetical protein P691DRAFT_318823 [Macrolepiota fuliginosa MF-IS2]|uniref:Uncharacterized protein n=1 Tax=Macrolepiota fuliginosa MF-IS2 TaxID=1400762 RepID=A0A9P5XQI4_9AGAR|nr:hypothetical protein P691DRAFT_318823 [Macrolepiota fuliginosa MF-IS2]